MEYKQYDLSNEEEITELSNLSITDIEDDFLTDIIDLNPEIAVKAFKEMVLNRKNPKMDEFEVLESFRKVGLNDTANYIHAFL